MITQPLKNTLALFAILAGLISIPLTWMTIQGAPLPSVTGFPVPIAVNQVKVTGINGSVTFLFQTPIWILVGIAIFSNVLQLMQTSRQFAVPPFAEWVTALFGFIWIKLGICVALLSDMITLGIGSLLGLFCAGVAVFCLVVPTLPDRDSFLC
tara:strand:- start:535 stop:993 length:459 start_codon:yes stop_codon:yes gene_type:complete